MNKLFLTVVLGEDPKVRKIGTDNKVTKFVAFHKPNYAKESDKDLRIFIEAWNGLGTSVENNLTKGDKVIVTGEFKAPEDDKGQVYPTIRVTEPIEFVRVKKFNHSRSKNTQTNLERNDLSGNKEVNPHIYNPQNLSQQVSQKKLGDNNGLNGFQVIDDDIPNF